MSNMKTIVALLLAVVYMSEGQVYCPTNYCLKQITGGMTASDFSCESYANTGHVCAMEDGPACPCVGQVHYGNYERVHSGSEAPAAWDKPQASTSLSPGLPCTNAQFSNVVNGAKVCVCYPTAAGSPVRDTKAPASTQIAGYSLPTCLIQKLAFTSVVTNSYLWTAGVNEASLGLILGQIFSSSFLNLADTVIVHDFDKSSFASTVQLNGVSDVMATFTKINGWRNDSTELKTTIESWFSNVAPLLGDQFSALAAVQFDILIFPRAFTNAVECPTGYCLNQIARGTSSNSFDCQRYANTAYQCAGEDQTCECSGTVKYGNWERIHSSTEWKPEIWTNGTTVSKSIECTNAQLTHIVSGAKFCTCDTSSSSLSRASGIALDGTSSISTIDGFTEPTCLTTFIGITPPSTLTYSYLWTAGMNQGVVDLFLRSVLQPLFSIPNPNTMIAQGFDNLTYVLTMQVPFAGSTETAAGASSLLLLQKNDQSTMKTYGSAAASAIGAVDATAGSVLAMVTFNILPMIPADSDAGPAVPAPTPYPSPTPTPTPTPTTTTMLTTTLAATTTSTTTATAQGSTNDNSNTTTPASSTGGTVVTGALRIQVSNATAILSNSTAKEIFENQMAGQIATTSSVQQSQVAVTVTDGSTSTGGRRLAAGTLNIAYTITTTSATQASAVHATMVAKTPNHFKAHVEAALASAGLGSVSVTSVVVTQSAQITDTQENSNAHGSHVLAVFMVWAWWVF